MFISFNYNGNLNKDESEYFLHNFFSKYATSTIPPTSLNTWGGAESVGYGGGAEPAGYGGGCSLFILIAFNILKQKKISKNIRYQRFINFR